MLPITTNNGLKRILFISGIFLLVISILSSFLPDPLFYRLTRVIICFGYFGLLFLLKKKKTNPYLAGFLFIYGISGIAIIWYENPIFATLSMFLNFLAYACFTKTLLPKVHFKNMNIYYAIAFSILIFINLYLLYMFIDMIDDLTQSIYHYLAILLFTVSFVSAGFFSLLYNHTYSTRGTFMFTATVYFIIFSEIFSAIGYYDLGLGDIATYISRGLLILGTAFIVYYSFIKKEENEELYDKIP